MIVRTPSIELSDIFTDETSLCSVVRYKFQVEKWQKKCLNRKPILQKPKLLSDKYKKIVFNEKCLGKKLSVKSKLIVLILDSPHGSEYNARFEPLVPANGNTGKAIDKYVESFFNAIISNVDARDKDNRDYFFAIVNPVQWQACLTVLLKVDCTNAYEMQYGQKYI